MNYKIEYVSSKRGDDASIKAAISKMEIQVSARLTQGLYPVGPVQIILDGNGGFFAHQTLVATSK